jgi:hypothetical protein
MHTSRQVRGVSDRHKHSIFRSLEDDRVKAARQERCAEVLEHCVLCIIALKPAEGQCNATAAAQAVVLDEVREPP